MANQPSERDGAPVPRLKGDVGHDEMKQIIGTFIVGLFLADTIFAQALAPKDNAIHLPSVTALKVEKVLYQHASKPQLMGDGCRIYIVQVRANDLMAFIQNNVSIDPDWTHGSMQKYKLYLDILSWLERWPDMKTEQKELSKVMDLDQLKRTEGLYFKAEYKRNSDGSFFTDATLWIIHPDKNQVIMLNGNT